ncbi:PP2C family protein-serine/threonine phosphatase [Streptomyces clavifer]|uniref:PP2C family protein-serine/threonine phosphatase n=1 Tax=Streptomyces clavifer TaxID=68188 RepID=UPI0037BC7C34
MARRQHRLRLASAGHAPPLLRDPAATPQTIALEVEPGPLLGVSLCTEAEYPLTTVALPEGPLLALYTDGLVETPDIDLTDSIAALAHVLTRYGDRPLDDLCDSLLRHAGLQHARTDGIALVLLRSR